MLRGARDGAVAANRQHTDPSTVVRHSELPAVAIQCEVARILAAGCRLAEEPEGTVAHAVGADAATTFTALLEDAMERRGPRSDAEARRTREVGRRARPVE